MQKQWFLFSSLTWNTPLLPHFLRHYAALGFTDWVVAVHRRSGEVDWVALEKISPIRIHRENSHTGVSDAARDEMILEGLRAKYIESEGDWHAIADVDEFYEYPLPLPELVQTARLANCVVGEFVDRLTTDGTLAPIRDDQPIEEQFPVRARVSRILLQAVTRKIILCKGFYPTSTGHHWMFFERAFGMQGLVHHYKWNGGMIEHLSLDRSHASLKFSGYERSVRKIFKHLEENGGRIRVEQFSAPPKFRLKFVMQDGRKLYPGTGDGFRLVDEYDAVAIQSMVARGAYDPALTTFVMDYPGNNGVRIKEAVLERADKAPDPEALGPLLRLAVKGSTPPP